MRAELVKSIYKFSDPRIGQYKYVDITQEQCEQVKKRLLSCPGLAVDLALWRVKFHRGGSTTTIELD